MSVKNRIKHFSGRYPGLFFPIAKRVFPRDVVQECLFSKEKEIVIEGFPRSANTFAVVAFRQAQQRHVPMAHHLHVEAQIRQGVRYGRPVIVLIRNPIDAIKSLLIRHPDISEGWAFRRYFLFYKSILSIRERVVLANFPTVTSDYGMIIQRVNDLFGTNYQLFQHTKENVAKVFREIDSINERLDGGKETHVARPSEKRRHVKNWDINERGRYAKLAVEIYGRLISSK